MDDVITIYTDGSAQGNPGPGGCAAILTWKNHRKEIVQGYRLTTNNRMELMGWIIALQAIKRPSTINIISDSKYVGESYQNGWAAKWKKNNWVKGDKKPAKNKDLWEQLLTLAKPHTIQFTWVKGHNGHDENEQCDLLAIVAARDCVQHLVDAVYESEQKGVINAISC